MKKAKIVFWVTTIIIFVLEGALPALTVQSEMTRMAFTHLGYPVYFIYLLTVFKVFGVLALIIPKVPGRVKEWAYAGFGFDFVSALVSILVVDGLGFGAVIPIIAFGLLAVSYISYHKLHPTSL